MAEMLFFAARGLMEAGRYAEACTKLEESLRLDPASGTLLNLAVCHEHEGKLASAWGEFRQALQEAQRAQRSDREELAKQHAEALERELPFLTVEVPSHARVPGLEVLRNGVAILPAAWSTELPVDPGRVDVELRAPGYRARTETVQIASREHVKLTVAPLTPVPVTPPEAPYWTWRRGTGVGLLAGTAVAVGLAVGAGIRTLRLRDDSDAACPELDGEYRCSRAGADAMSSARRWALGADLAIGTALVSAALGTYLFVIAADEDERAVIGVDSRARKMDARRTASRAWSFDLAASSNGARGTVQRSF